jgi:hypothetical protein
VEQISTYFTPEAQTATVLVGGVVVTTLGLEALLEANELRPSVKQKRAEELIEHQINLETNAKKDLIDHKARVRAQEREDEQVKYFQRTDREPELLREQKEVVGEQIDLKKLEKEDNSGILQKVSQFITGSGKK